MKKLLKTIKQISILILAITFLGCEDDDANLPKVVAGFSYTINADTGVVTFINLSTNATNYIWNFGDESESSSTLINPVKAYQNGTYTVVLSASVAAGSSDIFQDEITILIPETASLPISFDGANTKYDAEAFEGAAFEVVANPAPGGTNDVASKVGAITNSGAAYEGIFFELGTDIDLATDKTIKMNFWSEAPINVLMKLEKGSTSTADVIVAHGGSGWEELLFNFSESSKYSKLVLFVDGPGTTTGTFYLDDIMQSETAEIPNQGEISEACEGSILQDFETAANSIFGDFGGGTAVIIENPYKTVNTSDKVGQMEKFAGELYGGTTMSLSAPVDFSNGEVFTMDVFSQRASALTFKLEGLGIEEVISTAGTGWETMTFDFTGRTTGAAVPAITLIFDNGTNGDAAGDPDAWTFLFDNLRLCDSGTNSDQGEISVACAGSLLQDFETADNSVFGDFGGGTALVIDNPNTTVNTSAKVGQMQKFAAEVYGGTTMSLSAPVDFSNGEVFTMDVFSQRASALTFKLEGLGIEEVISTAGTGWETMTFDFTGRTTGAAVPAITLIFDNGTNGDAAGDPDAWTFLFDNLRLCDNNTGGGGGDSNNIAINGNFETGDTSGWTSFATDNNGTFTISSDPSCGDFSGRLKADVAAAGGAASFPVIKQANIGIGIVQPNSEVTVSFDLRGSVAGSGGVFFAEFFSELTGGGTSGGGGILGGGPLFPTDTWTRYTFTTTTGTDVSGGVTLQLKADCGGNADCVLDAYIDNVYIAMGNTPDPTPTDCSSTGDGGSGGGSGGGGSVDGGITVNGDFETGDATGFTIFDAQGGVFTVTNEEAQAGTFSGKLVAGEGTEVVVKQANLNTDPAIAAGASITISFDLKGSLAGDGGVVFAEFFSEISPEGVSKAEILSNAPLTPTNTWTNYSFTTTTGNDVSGGVTLQLKAACGAVSGCGVVAYFDNLSVTVN